MALTDAQRSRILQAFDQVEPTLRAHQVSLDDTPFGAIKAQLISGELSVEEAVTLLRAAMVPLTVKVDGSEPDPSA